MTHQIPMLLGALQHTHSPGAGTLKVVSGQPLTLKHLAVGKAAATAVPITLKVGESVKW
jgi:hypothetical protein